MQGKNMGHICPIGRSGVNIIISVVDILEHTVIFLFLTTVKTTYMERLDQYM